MHLKTLSLAGFKSFADRTRIECEPGVTWDGVMDALRIKNRERYTQLAMIGIGLCGEGPDGGTLETPGSKKPPACVEKPLRGV